MLINNCNIIYLDKIENGSLLIKNGKIKEINPTSYNDNNIIDSNGLYISPGFIDVHIHGAGGYDTMDGTVDSLNSISKIIVKHGTTAFTPTTMTVSTDDIRNSLKVIKKLKEEGTKGAHVLGAHLEGPFISPNAIGAQNPNFILAPSIAAYNEMVGDSEDAVVSITISPEVNGAKELIK